MVRQEPDPQKASKVLVDHALSRFSTDNLSCMIVRFDKAALASALSPLAPGASDKSNLIGVEGDPPSSVRGGITETEAIIQAAKKGMPVGDDPELSRISTDMIVEEEQNTEPGPELDPSGLEKVKEKAQEGQRVSGVGGGPGPADAS